MFLSRIPGNRDLRLHMTSEVIDVGDDAYASSTDFLGLPRIQDGNADGIARIALGAYEFSADTDSDGIYDYLDDDDDNDGVLGIDDCADTVPGVAYAAEPVGNTVRLDMGIGGARLSWQRSPHALVFNVYRGRVIPGQAWSYDMVCLDPETPDLESFDPESAPAGTAFFYLVSAENACGESYAGLDWQGLETYPSPTCGAIGGDADSDGIWDAGDNCPHTPNPEQLLRR